MQHLVALVLIGLLGIAQFALFADVSLGQPQVSGPAAEKLIFRGIGSQDIADREIKAGRLDLFLFNLKTETARRLRTDPTIKLLETPATMYSIILNPAPAPSGQLNPFSIREVRQAIQYLVNREEVVSVIFKGLAQPMFTFVSPFDLDYVTVFEDVKSLGIRYDPDYARSVISDAMRRAGAELVDGVWRIGGREISLKLIYRAEDERREIGEMLRTELERVGFRVEPILLEFGPAVERVYSRDPAAFDWHIYTEGWGRGGAARYEAGSINQFCAPWLGNMPGWREVGFWQYENSTLDELGQRLFKGDYSSKEERDELFRRMTSLCVQESVRVWVATAVSVFPASPDLSPLVLDIVGGPRSIYTLREALNPGRADRSLVVGHLWVEPPGGRSAWNPVGGFGDVYSVDIYRNINDPPLARHPFSGKPIPFRAEFKVEASSPRPTVQVPGDAFIWDAQAGGWRRVGPGVTAKSKVVYDFSKYIGTKWHHGQEISWADILYPIYQAFDIAYNDKKSRIETAIAVTSRPYLETFKGFRILDGSRLEVYVDYWHFEPEVVAEYALPTSVSMPWEVLLAMDTLVFERRRAAYSDTAAARFNPEFGWINLVKERVSRHLAEVVLSEFLAAKFVAEKVLNIDGVYRVSAGEAEARYRAAIEWFRARRHLVIGQGPFMLERFDGPSQTAELAAFRDPTYPFKPGRWSEFTRLPQFTLTSPATGELNTQTGGTITLKLAAPQGTKVRYIIQDAARVQVVASGDATPKPEGVYEVRVSPETASRLRPGLYRLSMLAYSPDELGVVLEVESELRVTAEQTATTRETITQTTPTTTPSAQTPQQTPLLFVGIGLAAVVALVLVALLRRRGR
ncbi:MAG: ABC transporter substrate-binding protein [Nitrososphaerota archaeon]|nr:ABC transporter substrate-binding protein [Candidatus Calditenuaceae archaeon]MDW8073265.1 ABC transporter substrate-binding protein [Nitrososphaerota archaeon]